MESKRTKLTKVSTNSDLLPIDLIAEIIKRLPLKQVVRFLSVSKLWSITIRSRYFKKLFLDESLTRPKSLVLVFRVKHEDVPFSSVEVKHTREISSSASLTSYHVTCYTRKRTPISHSVHGLICFGPASNLVVYNPCTRRSITLPKVKAEKRPINHYLGYDPINDDYKVLCITRKMPKVSSRRGLADEIRVLTLGCQDPWRIIQDNIPPPHSPENQELCINGVLYYRAYIGAKLNDFAIISFDVRSEKFGLIKEPCKIFRGCSSRLTNYEGKLAIIFFEKNKVSVIGMWILENASKEEWLKKSFDFPDITASSYYTSRWFRTTDSTNTDEFTFIPSYLHVSLPAVSWDLKTNTLRTFETEGTTEKFEPCRAESVSSQIETLMFL